jgi:hypothetical protein
MKAIEELDGSAARRPCRKATRIMVAYRLALAASTSPGGEVLAGFGVLLPRPHGGPATGSPRRRWPPAFGGW